MKSTTFAALMLLAASGMAGAGGATMDGVSEQVEVDAGHGKVVVTLTVDNAGQRAVYVPKALFEDDELIAPVFQVRDMATGKDIDYIGRKVKRGPITMDDYLAVKPGAKKSNSIDITSSYDFRAGEHGYQLSYSGGYIKDPAHLNAVTPVAVAPVTFTFRK